MIYDADDR